VLGVVSAVVPLAQAQLLTHRDPPMRPRRLPKWRSTAARPRATPSPRSWSTAPARSSSRCAPTMSARIRWRTRGARPIPRAAFAPRATRSAPGSGSRDHPGSTSGAFRTASTRWPISSNEPSDLKYGNCLNLYQEFGLRQCGDRDQGARRHLLVLAEELLADRPVISAVADVGQIGVDLDDVAHRAAAGLDLCLHRLQRGTRLRLEVARVGHTAIVVVGHLAREVEDRLGAGHLDGLRIGRRVPNLARGVLLDLWHEVSLISNGAAGSISPSGRARAEFRPPSPAAGEYSSAPRRDRGNASGDRGPRARRPGSPTRSGDRGRPPPPSAGSAAGIPRARRTRR